MTLPNRELFTCRTAQSKMYFIWDRHIGIRMYFVIKKPSQVLKPPLKTSACQPRWAKPLNITVNDESISYLLHSVLPEIPRIRKSARLAFLLCIYKMFWMFSNVKMYLTVILPWRSQWQACFSAAMQLLTPTSKIPRNGQLPSPASMRRLSKVPKTKGYIPDVILLFIYCVCCFIVELLVVLIKHPNSLQDMQEYKAASAHAQDKNILTVVVYNS